MDNKIKYIKNNLSIIMTYYNTPNEYFINSINSIIFFNIPIYIYDDGSSEKYKNYLKKYEKYDNINIIYNNENKGQATATYELLKYVNTKYILRIDSDDVIKFLPNAIDTDKDIYFGPNNPTNIYEVLKRSKGINHNIFTKRVLMFMYEDHEYMSKYSQWILEDQYAIIKLLHSKHVKTFNFEYNILKTEFYMRIRRKDSQSNTTCTNILNNKMEIFKLYLMNKNYKTDEFIKFDITMRGYKNKLVNVLLPERLIKQANEEYNYYKKIYSLSFN